eukprot:7314797-Prymnesium_polylepis.1
MLLREGGDAPEPRLGRVDVGEAHRGLAHHRSYILRVTHDRLGERHLLHAPPPRQDGRLRQLARRRRLHHRRLWQLLLLAAAARGPHGPACRRPAFKAWNAQPFGGCSR